MKVLILHCWGGNARGCWRGWLADGLRKNGVEVVNPELPDTNTPRLDEWLGTIRKRIKKFDEDWILVGHSLGCPTILRLLESFGKEEMIHTAILVAAFAKKLAGYPPLDNFVEAPFDWKKIKTKAKRFVVINSDNDPFIELSEAERVTGLLGTELVVERNGGHMNEGGGWAKYERVLKLICERK